MNRIQFNDFESLQTKAPILILYRGGDQDTIHVFEPRTLVRVLIQTALNVGGLAHIKTFFVGK